ncbi:MAG: anti-sigma factor antagonist, partial [Clostridia bacterium]
MLVHEKRRAEVVVKLSGELDHSAAERIRPEIDELIRDPKVTRLVFDLGGINFMDSSGIGIILGRYRLMHRRGGTVADKGVGRQIDRIFEMAG